MNYNPKLTWEDGKSASWEGVEMLDEACQHRFGCIELLYNNDDNVVGFIKLEESGESITYRIAESERQAVLDIINDHSFTSTKTSYSNNLDEAHGFGTEYEETILTIKPSFIDEINSFVLIKEFPETVKIKDYEEFSDAIDDYFTYLQTTS